MIGTAFVNERGAIIQLAPLNRDHISHLNRSLLNSSSSTTNTNIDKPEIVKGEEELCNRDPNTGVIMTFKPKPRR